MPAQLNFVQQTCKPEVEMEKKANSAHHCMWGLRSYWAQHLAKDASVFWEACTCCTQVREITYSSHRTLRYPKVPSERTKMLQPQRPLQQLLSAQKVDQRLIHSRCLHFCFILIHRAQWNRPARNGGNGLSGICYAVGHDGRFRDLRKSWVETSVLAAQQEGNVRRKCMKCTFFVKQAIRCNPLSKTPLDHFHLVSENVTSREKRSARF